MSFTISQVKIISSWFVNLSAGWTLIIFASKDIFTLTGAIFGAIFSLRIAFELEKSLEND